MKKIKIKKFCNISVTLASAAIVFGLCGCAPQPMIWVKPGASQQDYNKDSYDCERDLRQSGYYGDGLAGAINMRGFFERCMIAHGWSQSTYDANSDYLTGASVPTKPNKQHQSALKKAEIYCNKALPKKRLGNPEYNQCISDQLE